MTGYQSKKVAAQDKLDDDDALTIAYKSGYYDGKKAAQPAQEQIQPDKVYIEDDGCPTEKSVLQRFWREHQKMQSKEPEQEPVAKRPWVGLTDEDLKLLSAEWRIVYGAWMDDFARDIEAKLKEKNCG